MPENVSHRPALNLIELPEDGTSDIPDSGESRLLLRSEALPMHEYADRLMDEVFADLEHALEPGASLPADPADQEPVPPTKTLYASSQLLLSQSGRGELEHSANDDDREIEEIAALLPVEEPESAAQLSQAGGMKSFDRLLLAVTCASLFAAGAIWLVLRYTNPQLIGMTTPPEVAEPAPANPNQEFLGYVQRSLEAIDRRAAVSRSVPSQESSESGELPSISVAGNPPSSDGSVDRVYIPVYQAPAAVPGTASSPAAPATTTAPSSTAAAPAPQPMEAPGAVHVLVGVLELGDRSSALFEISGTTQRVYVGENIGSSGWTLVSVTDGEAIVRRNGEVRSIYVGQRF